MRSGEARGAAGAACCILRWQVGSIWSLLSSSSEARKDPTVAASKCTRGLMSPVRLRTMGGSSSLHIASRMPSNLHYRRRSSHMAAIRRLLLLPTLVLAPMPSSGRNHRNNNMVSLVAFMVGRLPRSCGNCSKSKPFIKTCKIERWSSGHRGFLHRQVVTYTGTHRFLHSDSTLK